MGRWLLQSGTAFLLQSGTVVVTKWDSCYKVRRMLLQSGTGVTKCDDCYKVCSNRNQQLGLFDRILIQNHFPTVLRILGTYLAISCFRTFIQRYLPPPLSSVLRCPLIRNHHCSVPLKVTRAYVLKPCRKFPFPFREVAEYPRAPTSTGRQIAVHPLALHLALRSLPILYLSPFFL